MTDSPRIERLRLEMVVSRARSAKAEIVLKIAEREEDIERMRKHLDAQDAEIAKAESAMAKLEA